MSPSHAKYHTYAFRLLTGPPQRSPQIQSSLFSCLCQTVQFLKHLCLGAEQAMLTSAENSEMSASCVTPQRFRMIYFLNLPSPLFQFIRAVLAFCRLQSNGCTLMRGLDRDSGEILVTCQKEIPGIWWSPSLSSQPGWLPVPWAEWQPAGQGRIAQTPANLSHPVIHLQDRSASKRNHLWGFFIFFSKNQGHSWKFQDESIYF